MNFLIPFDFTLDSEGWQSGLRQLGIDVAAFRAAETSLPTAQIRVAVDRATGDTLVSDVARVLLARTAAPDTTTYVREALIPELILESADIDASHLEFQDCLFKKLEIDSAVANARLPVFVRCYFASVDGRVGPEDLPSEKFAECEFETFDESAKNTKAILEMSLPLGVKVLITILRKLFVQSGRGRREGAFFRGLDPQSARKVPDLLDLLQRCGFAVPTKLGGYRVWLPCRDSAIQDRARKLINSPNLMRLDPIYLAASKC